MTNSTLVGVTRFDCVYAWPLLSVVAPREREEIDEPSLSRQSNRIKGQRDYSSIRKRE